MKFTQKACDYSDAVVDGSIPACEYVKQACKRFMDDLDRSDIYFDVAAVESVCLELEKYPHVKGKWAAGGELLRLSDWQIFVIANLFGFKRENGKRRFREGYIEVPRKNGKTFFIAGLGLYMLTKDGEYGAEVYCGATSEAQAHEVFRPAKQICQRDSDLREYYGIEPNAKSIVILKNGSRFEPVIGNPGDGASPSCGIADEFHEHKTSDLVDTFITGMGAREHPLMLYITTAGSDIGGPCYEKRDDVKKILSGAVMDDSIFGVIYTLDEDDAWDTVEAQKKANPNYGVSVDPDFLVGQLEQARRSATKQASYKTKHLDMWIGAKQAWMNMLAYQTCRNRNLTAQDLKGRRCYIGIDLASTTDIADMAILYPPHGDDKWTLVCRHYLPEEKILDGGSTRYKAWHSEGWITATPGNVIDYEFIEDDLKSIRDTHQIVKVAFDPFQATQFSTRMQSEGLPMVQYGATVKNFSSPMKELEAMILKKKIHFQSDPVLQWMFSNVVAKVDKKENIFPDKERRESKIDGVVAAIMALGLAMSETITVSPYEERGVRVV